MVRSNLGFEDQEPLQEDEAPHDGCGCFMFILGLTVGFFATWIF